MKLKLTEIERGWVMFTCPAHGPLVATVPSASVYCGGTAGRGKRCNKRCAGVPWTPTKALQNKG